MEKNQYDLCLEVLKRLQAAHVLDKLILIGSWCIPFYKEYFSHQTALSSIRTRDIDFLVPLPLQIPHKVDIPKLLNDLGFVTDMRGEKGYLKLEHPLLIVEFLVPQKGEGTDRPYRLPNMGLNATALPFLELLTTRRIHTHVAGIELTLPHPANFAIHKLIVSLRRKNMDKRDKDQKMALEIAKALIAKGETAALKTAYDSISKKWQTKLSKNLASLMEYEIQQALH